MRFELETSAGALLDGLRAIAPAIERRPTLPILSHVCFEDGRMRATDLDLEIEAGFAVSRFEGAICLEHRTLMTLMRHVPRDETVTLVDQQQTGRVQVRMGASEYQLPSLPASDHQRLIADGLSHDWDCGNAGLARVFKRVSPAISTEEVRYYLNGVCLSSWFGRDEEGHEERPCVVATDGHRLIAVDVPSAKDFTGQIIPRKAVKIVCGLGDPQQMRFYQDGQSIQFRWPGVSVSTKLIDGAYPDFSRVVPQRDEGAHQISWSSEEVRAALARLSAVSVERSQSVTVSADETEIRLSAKTAEAGEGVERLTEARCEGPDLIEFGLNGKYLRAHLDSVSDECGLQVTDAISPVASFDEGAVSILMPLRV